ncbi:LysM-like peptidoglycan-binding domain-containing protein [Pasteurella atlantica]|uniref:LysM-like peptidoglycan-binding domain-containing protein n=1 Tax=Pasteurellaceae TaxID=712 RepID=UPI002755DBC5|nr:LysM-like peptidoglycan-binding domain-containing protein [Pasteurella atlantica]MDP8099602.1 LysM-like peptidoglycan-binding domain-containing protein [Pasteurella atlantica]MDP8107597.1 LysM-like peptidoglycan-binding domain-containing protein [Pasteurella atlantica]MDP8117292.1 LysM-like peptidoglycan-binding domain-containing protein [Pasteurella atlantica]
MLANYSCANQDERDVAKKRSRVLLTYPKPSLSYRGIKFSGTRFSIKDMDKKMQKELINQVKTQPSTQTEETFEQAPSFSDVTSEKIVTASDLHMKKRNSSVKYIRWAIVFLIILLLGVVFWLLKPNEPQKMKELQTQQSNNLPIEFHPIDENEAKRQKEEQLLQAQKSQTVEPKVLQVNLPSEEKVPTVVDIEVISEPETFPQSNLDPIVEAQEPKVTIKNNDVLVTSTTKTLTMKRGVSLMQLFRDNHLSIADVNEMARVKGGSKIFQHLNVGDKVIVQLNDKRRVIMMDVKGGRFIRQSNGTYIYKR